VDQVDLQHFIASVADVLITIEVGAIYPIVGDAAGAMNRPWAVFCKELVLDIDLNDYGALRFCGCGEAHSCCVECFNLYLRDTAIPVIRSVIQSRGWTNASLNYSGNRGVHVWIFEECVMHYGRREREHFLDFIARPPSDLLRKWTVDIYEPVWELKFLRATAEKLGAATLAEIERELVQHFPNCCLSLAPMPTVVGASASAPAIPGTTLRAKWQHLRALYSPGSFEQYSERFLHKLLGPRLDRQVTIDIHHLTKSPWSIHPVTGCIAQGLDWLAPELKRSYVE
jgi:DNA primase catalytic subunit